MNTLQKLAVVGVVALGSTSGAEAAIVALDLQGTAGFGLTAGNETHAIFGTPGSGGELNLGILYNDSTNNLSIDIGWGTGKGFTNLTGNATGGHIHGATTSGGAAAFTQDAPAIIFLDSLAGWNPSSSNGGFTGTVNLTETQEGQLLAGRFYINIHTSTNSGGEIRGNLVVVPEPATLGLAMAGVACFAMRRRRVVVEDGK